VLIRPASKVVIKFLQLMMKHGYIGEFEVRQRWALEDYWFILVGGIGSGRRGAALDEARLHWRVQGAAGA
jgi:ribosomal protein S8